MPASPQTSLVYFYNCLLTVAKKLRWRLGSRLNGEQCAGGWTLEQHTSATVLFQAAKKIKKTALSLLFSASTSVKLFYLSCLLFANNARMALMMLSCGDFQSTWFHAVGLLCHLNSSSSSLCTGCVWRYSKLFIPTQKVVQV